jgi:catechol 2,3-dioxygenase-like lactoylglutathione lyase family enzyme
MGIEHLIEQFEERRLTRRELIASLTALVASAASADAGQTSPSGIVPLAKGRSLNHVSLAVTDVQKAADFYGRLFDASIVSRPGNGGLNLGLGDGFLGVYKLANPGTVNHVCVGVDDFDADRLAAKCKEMGISARVDRNPANRTSGGDQLYIQAFDNQTLQVGPHGYQG